ncbi:probable polyamine transporter At3g13620 [Humulus lupulus]|uniref:probable polyamine transporter At3g13620 n=1 Tax=Humulus lupulus TaxID=3486 RepID=UPI002B415A96|nr:probable polyamine transporter At3g13620 [Humulus lupulus]
MEAVELPTTTKPPTNPKKLTLLPLIFLIYFEVAGGPYGEEPAVKAAGPLLALIGFLVFPFIWSIPEALVTAELSTAYPGNGGFVIWAQQAFGPFWGSLMGTWKFLCVVINIATFPILCVEYLEKLFPVLESGWPRYVTILAFIIILAIINYIGLTIVGYVAVILALISISPFVVMTCFAIPKIRPGRWIGLGQKGVKKDWSLYFNTLFWNLNFWDNVSTLAGEVENPHKTFPKALLVAVIFTCLSYLIPLFAVTGSVAVDQSLWETGFHAEAAKIIAGNWLKIWIEIGAVLSAIGLFQAQLSSSSYQILGMAEIGVLPKIFAYRSKKFNTPLLGILVSTGIVLAVSYLDLEVIIAAANFLYSLGMLLEFASFVWLRRKFPELRRPYKVPMGLVGLVLMCLIPSAFLLFVMSIARKMVYLISGVLTAVGIVWFFFIKLCRAKRLCQFNSNQFQEDQY